MDNFELCKMKALTLPLLPGVYIMRDKQGQVIYVGKAKKLKNRVSQYFQDTASHSPKTRIMVSKIADFDVITASSEFEALVLECSLIKRHLPRYNILLKDDKGYPYIRLDTAEQYPRITMASRPEEDGAQYFGPFGGRHETRQALESVCSALKLPTCNRKFPQEFGKARPCLNYYIKNCMGVCRGKISEEEYNETLNEAIDFIKGGSTASVEKLTERMFEAAEAEDFERAAVLRDRIKAIEGIASRQKVVFSKVKEQDVIAIAKSGESCCAVVLSFRGGRLVDKDEYILKDFGTEPSFVTEFLQSFYSERTDIPKEIALHEKCEEAELLERWLSEKAGRKVNITVPQKGERKQVTDMAYNNAAERLSHEKSILLKCCAPKASENL